MKVEKRVLRERKVRRMKEILRVNLGNWIKKMTLLRMIRRKKRNLRWRKSPKMKNLVKNKLYKSLRKLHLF